MHMFITTCICFVWDNIIVHRILVTINTITANPLPTCLFPQGWKNMKEPLFASG